MSTFPFLLAAKCYKNKKWNRGGVWSARLGRESGGCKMGAGKGITDDIEQRLEGGEAVCTSGKEAQSWE